MVTRVAVDIGGTFTDVVIYDEGRQSLKTAKMLCHPEDLMPGIKRALTNVASDASDIEVVIHGSTVVINALIERKGARSALITTAGFRDVYEIGRINRPDSFNFDFERHRPLIPRDLIYEVPERMSADGRVVTPLESSVVEDIARELVERGIESVAIVLLHAYRNSMHEKIVGDILRRYMPDAYITLSHEISREYREFERTSTVAANAFVGPMVNQYLNQLEDVTAALPASPILAIMQSSGGLMDTTTARRQCVRMMESGPAGGVVGVINTCSLLKIRNAIAFDMGGTTSKASVIRDLRFPQAADYFVGGYGKGLPIRIPTLDIVEIGTGGGSIAWADAAGGFHVGPRSADATPGPACFGRGGDQPTVTDAALVLGLLAPDATFGDAYRLNLDLANDALETLCEAVSLSRTQVAKGIISIATASMANAVRAVTSACGLDPRDFVLFAFGGNGPMVGAAVASELGIREVIVPPHSALFSALGMLGADLRHDLVQTKVQHLDQLDLADLEADLRALERECEKALALPENGSESVRFQRAADMRYIGQEHTVSVSLPQMVGDSNMRNVIKSAFDAVHEERFAHSASNEPAEIVSLRVSATRPLNPPPLPLIPSGAAEPRQEACLGTRPVIFDATPFSVESTVWSRSLLEAGNRLTGPALVEEGTATTVVRDGDAAIVDHLGNLHILIGEDLESRH